MTSGFTLPLPVWGGRHKTTTAEGYTMQLEQNANWQTKARGDNDSEYQIYLACADDGKGNEFMTGKPLKTYDEWLAS
ncbi:hypothetical protein ACOA8Y_003027 [Serratia marcescens]